MTKPFFNEAEDAQILEYRKMNWGAGRISYAIERKREQVQNRMNQLERQSMKPNVTDTKRRKCLGLECRLEPDEDGHRRFVSAHKGNRLCPNCLSRATSRRSGFSE